MELVSRTYEFVTPSGYKYLIREQNGSDEDILSNPLDVQNLMNLTKFIKAIVVDTDFTSTGVLTLEDVDRIPLNDRYCILFQSRIFSLGDEVEFDYTWDDIGKQTYGQSLSEMLFKDYSNSPSQEELQEKPHAIPYYPEIKKLTDYELVTTSGKTIKFDLLNGAGERYMITLPSDKQTRNASLIARNLQLLVDGKWEKVTSFHLFSVKDMAEIRKAVSEYDPLFDGNTDVEHPHIPGRIDKYPIMLSPTFFFLTEE